MVQAISRNITGRAVLAAWLAAGTVLLVTNIILMMPVLKVGPVLVLRYFASLVLGRGALTQTDNILLTAVTGVVIHYVFSLLFTLLIVVVVHRWGLLIGIVGGAVLGLAIYGINFYTMTTFFPWFFAINSGVLLLSHVLFGATAGGVYEMFDHYDLPISTKEYR